MSHLCSDDKTQFCAIYHMTCSGKIIFMNATPLFFCSFPNFRCQFCSLLIWCGLYFCDARFQISLLWLYFLVFLFDTHTQTDKHLILDLNWCCIRVASFVVPIPKFAIQIDRSGYVLNCLACTHLDTIYSFVKTDTQVTVLHIFFIGIGTTYL